METNNPNTHGSILVLELILTSQLYMDQYIDNFPTMQDQALNFSVDPGCSCKDDIINHYNQNTEQVSSFTEKFLSENPKTIDIRQFIKKHETNEVAGRIFKIDKTDEAYANLVNTIHTQNWIFKHMSVTVDENNYIIFFS